MFDHTGKASRTGQRSQSEEFWVRCVARGDGYTGGGRV